MILLRFLNIIVKTFKKIIYNKPKKFKKNSENLI